MANSKWLTSRSMINWEVNRQNMGYMGITGISADENFSHSVQSFSLPNITNDIIEIPYGNDKVHISGRVTFEPLAIVMIDFIDHPTARILKDWKDKVYGFKNASLGRPNDYKCAGYLVQVDPKTGEDLRKWDFFGAWPSALQFGNIDQTGGEKITISLTLSVDFIEPVFFK
jgi:hypothetical protein